MESGFWPLRDTPRRSKTLVVLTLVLAGCAVLAILYSTQASPAPLSAFEVDEVHFMNFAEKFGRQYSSEEERSSRFAAFRENLAHVRRHNAGHKNFVLGLTKFADMSNEEFTIKYTANYSGKSSKHYNTLDVDNLPSTVDWVTAGAVTPIKNQEFCGSCWAFAATGALEGVYFLSAGELLSFSQQQLVDCSQSFGTSGCDGGEMDDAYRYIAANGGLETAEEYPYEAKDGKCRLNDSPLHGAISGYSDVPKGSELQLKAAVARQPVAVGVQANEVVWQMYESGVMDSDCGQKLNHGVLVVGYGSEDGVDYWLVKNTWGDDWGIEGYVKIKRDDEATDGGLCGIALDASYPSI